MRYQIAIAFGSKSSMDRVRLNRELDNYLPEFDLIALTEPRLASSADLARYARKAEPSAHLWVGAQGAMVNMEGTGEEQAAEVVYILFPGGLRPYMHFMLWGKDDPARELARFLVLALGRDETRH